MTPVDRPRGVKNLVLTEQEAADQDVRFHDAIYRASHHTRPKPRK